QTILLFASQLGDEKLEGRLRQEHVERLDRQPVLSRRRENTGVVRDDTRKCRTALQTLHDLPGGETTSNRIEPRDALASVGRNTSMADQEQALERRGAGAGPVHPVHEGSHDSRNERSGAVTGEREDSDRAAGQDGSHGRTFSSLSRALL